MNAAESNCPLFNTHVFLFSKQGAQALKSSGRGPTYREINSARPSLNSAAARTGRRGARGGGGALVGWVPHAGEEGPHTCAGGPSGRPLFFYARPNCVIQFLRKECHCGFLGIVHLFCAGRLLCTCAEGLELVHVCLVWKVIGVTISRRSAAEGSAAAPAAPCKTASVS